MFRSHRFRDILLITCFVLTFLFFTFLSLLLFLFIVVLIFTIFPFLTAFLFLTIFLLPLLLWLVSPLLSLGSIIFSRRSIIYYSLHRLLPLLILIRRVRRGVIACNLAFQLFVGRFTNRLRFLFLLHFFFLYQCTTIHDYL